MRLHENYYMKRAGVAGLRARALRLKQSQKTIFYSSRHVKKALEVDVRAAIRRKEMN